MCAHPENVHVSLELSGGFLRAPPWRLQSSPADFPTARNSNQTCSYCNEERLPSDKHLFRPLDKDSAANPRRVREVMDHMKIALES